MQYTYEHIKQFLLQNMFKMFAILFQNRFLIFKNFIENLRGASNATDNCEPRNVRELNENQIEVFHFSTRTHLL